MKEIFPKVRFNTSIVKDEDRLVYHTIISTYLRKKHTDNKWYLQLVLNRSTSENRESVGWCLNDFMTTTYSCLLFGKVIPEMKDSYGSPYFELDEDQRSEEERLSI
jgi:hypothetical protein